MSSKPLKILTISIGSPRNQPSSHDFAAFHLKLLPLIYLNINRVALFCAFSCISISFFKYGLHACTQYPSLGLTNDWYNFSIMRVSLFTNVLLIIPRLLLADFAAVTQWLVARLH